MSGNRAFQGHISMGWLFYAFKVHVVMNHCGAPCIALQGAYPANKDSVPLSAQRVDITLSDGRR
jgi:hypothetical protein